MRYGAAYWIPRTAWPALRDAAAGSSASTRRSGSTSGSGFGERLDRLEEAVTLIERLLAGERVTQVIWIFRDPFDLETMRRPPEVRAALAP